MYHEKRFTAENVVKRINYLALTGLIPRNRIYFFDESGFTGLDSLRQTGWSSDSRIPLSISYYSKSPNYNLLCIIGVTGIMAGGVHRGSTKGLNVCEFFVDYVLPVIPEDSVVIMDNHPMHHGIAGNTLAQILALKYCTLLYLPPYSPDLNPIENSFGTMKYYLKDNPDLYFIDPVQAILLACRKVSTNQIENWYRLCGYQ